MCSQNYDRSRYPWLSTQTNCEFICLSLDISCRSHLFFCTIFNNSCNYFCTPKTLIILWVLLFVCCCFSLSFFLHFGWHDLNVFIRVFILTHKFKAKQFTEQQFLLFCIVFSQLFSDCEGNLVYYYFFFCSEHGCAVLCCCCFFFSRQLFKIFEYLSNFR